MLCSLSPTRILCVKFSIKPFLIFCCYPVEPVCRTLPHAKFHNFHTQSLSLSLPLMVQWCLNRWIWDLGKCTWLTKHYKIKTLIHMIFSTNPFIPIRVNRNSTMIMMVFTKWHSSLNKKTNNKERLSFQWRSKRRGVIEASSTINDNNAFILM